MAGINITLNFPRVGTPAADNLRERFDSLTIGGRAYPPRADDVRTYLATKPVRAGEAVALGGNVEPAQCSAVNGYLDAPCTLPSGYHGEHRNAFLAARWPNADSVAEPIPGSLAWVRSIAGEDAEVREEPAYGRVGVHLRPGTTRAEAQRIQDRLTREGPMGIAYGVFLAAPPPAVVPYPAEMKQKHIKPAPPPDAVVTVQLPGYVDKIRATIAIGAAESEETGVVCKACGAKERRQKHGPIATTMLHRDDCRIVREAPLVALVSQVPEGLDPVGWRAAVLAELEAVGLSRLALNVERFGLAVAAAIRDDDPLTGREIGRAAYHRAVTPHKAPAPERKGATWRERGTIYTQHADDAD